MKTATVSAHFVNAMLAGVRAEGYDVARILRDTGIPVRVLDRHELRVTFEQLSRLTLALIELTDNELFALLPKPMRRNTFRLACHCMLSAGTAGEALQIACEFFNVLDVGLRFTMTRDRGVIRLELRRDDSGASRGHYAVVHSLVTVHRTLCWLTGAALPVLHAEFDHTVGAHHDEYRRLFFGAPVRFGGAVAALTFSAAALRTQTIRDARELRDFVKLAPLTLLTRTVAPVQTATQVGAWLERCLLLRNRAPSIEEAAARFGCHPQALRRRLHKDGFTYKALKTAARRDLAIALLADPDIPVGAIAGRLGYSEPRAFIRAFRRWFATTPGQYRQLETRTRSPARPGGDVPATNA